MGLCKNLSFDLFCFFFNVNSSCTCGEKRDKYGPCWLKKPKDKLQEAHKKPMFILIEISCFLSQVLGFLNALGQSD